MSGHLYVQLAGGQLQRLTGLPDGQALGLLAQAQRVTFLDLDGAPAGGGALVNLPGSGEWRRDGAPAVAGGLPDELVTVDGRRWERPGSGRNPDPPGGRAGWRPSTVQGQRGG